VTGIAVTEPVLTAFRDGADVFVLRRADPVDIVAFVLIVVLVPALALWAVLQLLGALVPSRRQLVRGSLLALPVAVVVVRVLNRAGDPPRPLVLLAALAVGVAAALALARWPVVDRWLRLLAVFPILLGIGFLVTEPVSTLVFGGKGGEIASTTVRSPDPVVMVVLDELPTASLLDDDDMISAEQFPNLAALAEDSTWYRNHTSVAPSTPQAAPSVLTGRLPTSLDALPVAEEHPDSLFTELGGSYHMHVVETATELCPSDVCDRSPADRSPLAALLDDARALWSDQLSAEEEERTGDFAVRQSDPNAPVTFNRFLDGIEADDGPRLDFHHSLYPHQPWFHLSSGLVYDAPFVAEGLEDPAYSWTDPSAAASGRQRHLLQARHADALVGQLMARLRVLDRYDDSLIVVTADHGVAFEAGQPIRGLGDGNADQVMWTPLLVKEPGQNDGRIDEQPAQAVDVLPTIADHLDLELSFPTDGRSLLEAEDGNDEDDDERVFFDWSLNLLPPDENGLVHVDGRQGYADMLALPAPGAGDDPDLRFYRFGRHGDLVGRRLDALETGPPLEGTARLDQQAQMATVDTAVSPLPVYLSGDVPADASVDVAVVVNGTVGGWGRTEPTDTAGRQRFWTLVPTELLEEGANEITIAVIEAEDGPRRLRPVPLPSPG
jgi:hypothetical protein